MELSKDFYKFSLYSLLWFIPLVLIINGTAHAWVNFPDPLNEMATAFMTLLGFGINFCITISEGIKAIKASK